jgi:RimJ/RimL family protein N-acetyltransferase/ribosomal protein S18 acetylase RimI-like enzyme
VIPLSQWTARPRPDGRTLEGRFVRLEKLDPARHEDDLARELTGPRASPLYAWLPESPPQSEGEVRAWVRKAAESTDPFFYAVIDKASERAVGRMSFLRIDPANGVIEVGHILYGPSLQRTPGASEAQALFMRHVFGDLGYRRYEWKCNDRNAPSKRAALRFGFSFEGVFRQHMIVKGQNRDTAWFAMIDAEWPMLKRAFETWLDPANFGPGGGQRVPLGPLTARDAQAGPVRLRKADLRDRAAIETLTERAYVPNEALIGVVSLPRAADYGEVLDRMEVWLAEGAEGLEGLAILETAEPFTLWSVAVDPAAQGRGLGNALLAFAEERARQLGFAEVCLYTHEKLAPRIAWYERRGYERRGIEDLPDRRAVHLSKVLPAARDQGDA